MTEWTQMLVKNTKPKQFKQALKSDWKHPGIEDRTQDKHFIHFSPSVDKPGELVVWTEAIFLFSSSSLETYLNVVPRRMIQTLKQKEKLAFLFLPAIISQYTKSM